MSAPERLEGKQKFQVRGEIREALLAPATGGEQVALVQVPVSPAIGAGAVKQYDRARWRLRRECWTLAFNLFHRVRAAGLGRDCDLPVGKFSAVAVLAGEQDLLTFPFARCFLFEFLVPTVARQSAPIGHHPKFSIAQSDDLRAAPIVFKFALVDVVLAGPRRVQKRFSFRLTVGGVNRRRQRYEQEDKPFHKVSVVGFANGELLF